jgi:3-hydroxyacyl-CoA dehydrogenase
MWASTSRPVLLYDSSPAALRSAVEYISDVLGVLCFNEDTHPGHVATTTYLPAACRAEPGPWLVIEALPEELSLKRKVLSEVEALAPRDCILASNSSSFRTAEMLAAPGGGEGADGVKDGARLLNMHHYIPPRNRMVELMSSGSTAEAVFPFLAAQMESVGLRPLVLPADVQSTGFIFDRIWAAVKRETLAVLAEGVARHPADVDELFRDFFHAEKGPCEKMDEVGLDTVAKVEARYVAERPGIGSEEALEWLAKEYVDKGRLGEKSGDGLYTAEERKEMIAERELDALDPLEESKGA